MEILQHTDEHSPTLMRDVFEALIGAQVYVYSGGQDRSLSGKLVTYNGAILHIVDGSINYYIPAMTITAIGSDK